jgi:hypothetical protein
VEEYPLVSGLKIVLGVRMPYELLHTARWVAEKEALKPDIAPARSKATPVIPGKIEPGELTHRGENGLVILPPEEGPSLHLHYVKAEVTQNRCISL